MRWGFPRRRRHPDMPRGGRLSDHAQDATGFRRGALGHTIRSEWAKYSLSSSQIFSSSCETEWILSSRPVRSRHDRDPRLLLDARRNAIR